MRDAKHEFDEFQRLKKLLRAAITLENVTDMEFER